jgi:hypothetical protein
MTNEHFKQSSRCASLKSEYTHSAVEETLSILVKMMKAKRIHVSERKKDDKKEEKHGESGRNNDDDERWLRDNE